MSDYPFSLRRELSSVDATRQLGLALGKGLDDGILAMVGDLGAGKTCLTRALCDGAEVPADGVQSPTFTLINEYQGRVNVFHMDTYRLSPEDFYDLGIDDYWRSPGLKIVEWADRIEELLPSETLWFHLEHKSAETRDLHVYSQDASWQARWQTLTESLV